MTSGDGVSLMCVLQERVNRRLDDEKQLREQAVAALERRLAAELDRHNESIERRLKEPVTSGVERQGGDMVALEMRLSTEIDRNSALQTEASEQRLEDLAHRFTGELHAVDESCRKEVARASSTTQHMALKTMDAVQVALEGALEHLDSRLNEEVAKLSKVAMRFENERSRRDVLERDLAQVKARCDQDRGLHDRAVQDLAYTLRAEFSQASVGQDISADDTQGSRLITQATLEKLESRLRLEITQTSGRSAGRALAEVCEVSGDQLDRPSSQERHMTIVVHESLRELDERLRGDIQRLSHEQQVVLECSRDAQRITMQSLEELHVKFTKEMERLTAGHQACSACCHAEPIVEESSGRLWQDDFARLAAEQQVSQREALEAVDTHIKSQSIEHRTALEELQASVREEVSLMRGKRTATHLELKSCQDVSQQLAGLKDEGLAEGKCAGLRSRGTF